MVTELLEYRPGKWVKVVDGHIVGRATPEELAAWREARGHEQAGQLSLPDLDVDLTPPPTPVSSPGRTLDVPLRPAFERRGRRAEEPAAPVGPARPSAPERHVPGAAQPVRPQEPGGGPQRPAQPRPEDELASLSIEMAMAREASARRRQGLEPPAEEDGPRTVRRRLPTLGPAPAERPQASPATAEGTPLPKKTEPVPADRPQAKPKFAEVTSVPKPGPARRRPAAAAPAMPQRRRPEPPLPAAEDEAAPEEAPAEEAGPLAGPDAIQGPRYWWIYNASRQPMEAFLKEWLPKYEAKFGHEASFVICHADDVAAIQALGLDVDVSPLLGPGHLYLGHHGGGDGGRKGAGDPG